MKRTDPAKGQVWLVDLNPTRGHEQAGVRQVLIVSSDLLNASPADLVFAVPLTSRQRNVPTHVPVNPPEAGLNRRSFAKCEDLRSISKQRLARYLGVASSSTMMMVAERLRILLDL